MSDVKKFFEMLESDRSKEDLFPGEKPESMEETLEAYVNAASKLGFTVSADEIKAEFEARAAEAALETDETINGMQEVSPDEIDNVAGGVVMPHDCKDTFKDEENCWFNDGCDKTNNKYPDYRCKRQYQGKENGCSFLF